MTTDTPPPLEQSTTPDDIEKNKVFGVLAYISILFLVPLLAAKESKFARYHTNEGIVLFLAGLIVFVGLGIVSIPLAMIPFLNLILLPLWPVLSIGFMVLAVIGILNAAQGKMKPLPLLGGRFTLIKA